MASGQEQAGWNRPSDGIPTLNSGLKRCRMTARIRLEKAFDDPGNRVVEAEDGA